MVEKVAMPFTQSQISMDLDIRDNFDEKILSHIFFQNISKFKVQNLTVELENSCILDTIYAQNI